MKKLNVLEEFWYANIRPFEEAKPPDSSLSEKAMEARNILLETLSAEQKVLLETYESEFDVVSMEATKNAFVLSFQLGAKFMAAIEDY